jgi:hypothetical protein
MAHFTKMVDMAKTPEQINQEVDSSRPPSERSATSIADNLPKYPYGLCITIENEQLDKLELDGDCDIGDTIHFCVEAKVTSVSAREKEKGEDRRIELQITHIATEGDGESVAMSSEKRAQKRYGGEETEKPGAAGEMAV